MELGVQEALKGCAFLAGVRLNLDCQGSPNSSHFDQ